MSAQEITLTVPVTMPILITPRLRINEMTLADCAQVERLASDERVARTTSGIPHPYPVGYSRAWILSHLLNFVNGVGAHFAIRLKNDNTLIGCIGLGLDKANDSAGLGYWLGVEYWGHGYCTEALHVIISWAFAYYPLQRIEGDHLGTNPASGRVMQKVGMTYECTRRAHYKKNGVLCDLCTYSILRDEWQDKQRLQH
ncbi:putative GNAT family N-acetyltransferase [Paratrimastix pyriformis]|uniref:GNAT family N-acetyltransferase n=1 Tax=Paratrimastix pyriformis TaxID=342808 RepID=A0ABQ8U7A4_9EUKA|nr:putative GNAT family N-acetyltransferase [Paratrimastix pyriformis]